MIHSYAAYMACLLTGTGVWMFLAAFNNFVDRGTNIQLIGDMLSMRLLRDDAHLGIGLLRRAIPKKYAESLLALVVLYEVATSAALLYSGYGWIQCVDGATSALVASSTANFAIGMYAALWIFFMCGGLWFGYWIKQGSIQQVHVSLLQCSLLMFIANNLAATLLGHGLTL